MKKQIYVHFHYTPSKKEGNEFLSFAKGNNEYTTCPTPSDLGHDEVETLTLEEAAKKYPVAGGLVAVLAGAELPFMY